MEYPHNLFPAIHIVLCLILADIYARHTRGTLRVLSYIWFSLIGLSTVLTWQHHLVDVAGGVVLAGFSFYLFRESNARLPAVANVRVGRYYAAGAAMVLALVPAVWPWGAFLSGPLRGWGSLPLATSGSGRASIGRRRGVCRCVRGSCLRRVLIGQYLSLVYYRRQCRALG